MNILYKTLPKNKSPHGYQWTINKWHKIRGDLLICHNGFHASKNIINAMSYVNAFHVAIVEVKGQSVKQMDKECWSDMRIIKWDLWTKKDSVALAIFAAELVIDNYENKYPNNTIPKDAIRAAKAVLKRDSKRTRSAAWSAVEAVEAAARSAARSAHQSIMVKCHDFVIDRKNLK